MFKYNEINLRFITANSRKKNWRSFLKTLFTSNRLTSQRNFPRKRVVHRVSRKFWFSRLHALLAWFTTISISFVVIWHYCNFFSHKYLTIKIDQVPKQMYLFCWYFRRFRLRSRQFLSIWLRTCRSVATT